MADDILLIPPKETGGYWEPGHQHQTNNPPGPDQGGDNTVSDDEIDNIILENERNEKTEKPIPKNILDEIPGEEPESGEEKPKPEDKGETANNGYDISADEFADIELVVEILDMLMAVGCEIGADKLHIPFEDDEFNATPKQLKLLQKVTGRLLKSKNIHASPGKMFAAAIIAVYGVNFGMAWKNERKSRKREKDAYLKGRQDFYNSQEYKNMMAKMQRQPGNQQRPEQRPAADYIVPEQDPPPLFTTGGTRQEKKKGGRPKGSKDSYKRKRNE